MSGHSNIGPSSAERWISCPGSVQLSANFPKPAPNEYGAAGTVYHTLCEQLVTGKIDDLELMTKIGTTVKEDGFDIEISDEGVDGVILYRDEIAQDLALFEAGNNKTKIHHHVEKRVDLKSVDPDLWGTADDFMFQKGHKLIVTDAKFGKKVVEVAKNKQLGLYALGVMETFAGEVFDEVWLKVVQPLAGHSQGPARMWRAPMEWLKALREEARAAVIESRRPNARFKAGDHCGWCPAKNSCPTRDEWIKNGARESAGADFDVIAPIQGLPVVATMSMEALAKAYSWREPLEGWFGDVADRIQTALANGEVVPGYKLVDGRSNRKWIDEEKVVEEWAPLLPEGSLFEHKLLSPAKLEKLPGVGKGKIDHLTFKPEGKKAIARDEDPRPRAASKAQDDFQVLEDNRSTKEVLASVTASLDDLDAELFGAAPAPKRDPLWPL